MSVLAFMLSSQRQTTRAAAIKESMSMGRKKYHSSVMNLISAFIDGSSRNVGRRACT